MSNSFSFLKGFFSEPYSLQPLDGDAGHRNYYRASLPESKQTFILVNDHEISASKESHSFFVLQKYFYKNKIAVPKVVKIFEKENCALLEDLGKLSLQQSHIVSPENSFELYQQSIELLHKMHSLPLDRFPFSKKTLNAQKMVDEVRWAIENIQKCFSKDAIAQTSSSKNNFQRQPLKKENPLFEVDLSTLLQEVKSWGATLTTPPCLVHRDYHSKNIMVKNKKVYTIDFQDSVIGSQFYDIVSLVEDPYVDLDFAIKERLKKYFFDSTSILSHTSYSYEEFKQAYIPHAVQRLLKACGSFASFKNISNNKDYLKHIPICFKNILELTKYQCALFNSTRLFCKSTENFKTSISR